MNDGVVFLIQCYFGDTEDPYLASVNKAYIDMQTHTIKGEEDMIYKMRSEESEYLFSRLVDLPSRVPSIEDYDKWHKDSSDEMKEISKETIELTYGQIQKWINMSIKYLYTFRELGDERVDRFFVDQRNCFHAPLDSYVLNFLKDEIKDRIEEDITWSTIKSYNQYKTIQKLITFIEEYQNWSIYAKEANRKKNKLEKRADKHTFKRYIQDNYSDKGIPYCGKIRWNTCRDDIDR